MRSRALLKLMLMLAAPGRPDEDAAARDARHAMLERVLDQLESRYANGHRDALPDRSATIH